jgi:hypothetical protein
MGVPIPPFKRERRPKEQNCEVTRREFPRYPRMALGMRGVLGDRLLLEIGKFLRKMWSRKSVGGEDEDALEMRTL